MQGMVQLNIKPKNHRRTVYIVQNNVELLGYAEGQGLAKLDKLIFVELD